MNISEIIESEDGSVQFQADLNPEQVQFVMSVGINYLMGVGALKVKKDQPVVSSEDLAQAIIVEH